MSKGSKGLSLFDKADEINLYITGSMDKGANFYGALEVYFLYVDKLLCLFVDLETIHLFENIFELPLL